MDGQGKCCSCYILIFQMPFLYMQLTHAYDNTFLELRFLKVFRQEWLLKTFQGFMAVQRIPGLFSIPGLKNS